LTWLVILSLAVLLLLIPNFHALNPRKQRSQSQSKTKVPLQRNSEQKRSKGRGHPPCLVSQISNDGVGHQFEGKISCIAAIPFMPSDNYEYFHIKLGKTQHYVSTVIFEEFMNLVNCPCVKRIGEIFAPTKKDWPPATTTANLTLKHVPLIHDFMAKFPYHCRENSVLYVDNCWDKFYNRAVRDPNFFHSWYQELQPQLLSSFLSSPRRDDPLFRKETLNVVVHVRKGDAQKRIVGDEVFLALMDKFREVWALFSRRSLPKPPIELLHRKEGDFSLPSIESFPKRVFEKKLHFYVHSDGDTSNFAQEDVTLFPATNNSILQTVTQMVHADILIGSSSSLSNLGSMYSAKLTILPASTSTHFLPHHLLVLPFLSVESERDVIKEYTRRPRFPPNYLDSLSFDPVDVIEKTVVRAGMMLNYPNLFIDYILSNQKNKGIFYENIDGGVLLMKEIDSWWKGIEGEWLSVLQERKMAISIRRRDVSH